MNRHGYAKALAHEKMLEHARELEALVRVTFPPTSNAAKNMARIKAVCAIENLNWDALCAYVDLLAYSVKNFEKTS